MEEEAARQRAKAEKTARKEAKAKGIEGKRSLLIANGSYEFSRTIQSYRSKNLEQLGNLAASLGIPFAGLIVVSK